ncbi:MAG: BamA/OMP85 family outer membrane protein [Myxococcota bacterium]
MRWLWLLLAFSAALACAPIPQGRYTLEKLKIAGDQEVEDDEIEEVIASRPSPKFLGLFSGVIYDYEIFDRYVLERDLQRIERYYRSRGFYEARVRAARVVYKGRSAKVYIEIEEGPPVLLGRVDVHGIDELPAEVQRRITRRIQREMGGRGEPFEETKFEAAEAELKTRLEDQGYAYVKVRRSANVDLPRHLASAGFWVELGPKAVFGPVRIQGLGPLPEPPVRRALDLKEGDPWSRSELDEAKRALLDLNVFSGVSIEPDVKDGDARPERVPIVVKVERAKLRSVHLGFGVRLDTQRSDFHLIAGWEDSNFLGGFRRFLVEAIPGVVFYPTRLPDFAKPERLLPEARLRSEFRQPGFLEARTNALLRAQISIYPLILSSKYDPAASVVGYEDLRTSAGLERSVWKLYGTLSQNVQVSSPFSYKGPLDPNLNTVVISYPQLFASLDLRNDRVSPHRGAYFSMDTQVAGLGGDARDVKLQPEARAYVPLARRVTLALRGTVGFLFPQNYGDTVARNAEGQSDGIDDATLVRDIQIMFMRGFFSGGSGSNRGYAARDIGPHGRVPFYNPGQATMGTGSCREDRGNAGAPQCQLPLGGFTLWESTLELRYPLMGPLTGTLFGDASDVSPYKLNFRWDRPHLSVGFGLRYETPIGPVRFDLGYRIPGMQYRTPRGVQSSGEIEPATIWGLPLAASFGIGQVF